jgi:hypothetical protein
MRLDRSHLFAMAAVFFLTSCDSKDEVPKATPTALQKAAVVFEGNHTEAEIKQHFDNVFFHYGISTTEENYNKYSDMLVMLHESAKENGVSAPEMDILVCAERIAPTDPSSMPLKNALAFCTAMMRVPS